MTSLDACRKPRRWPGLAGMLMIAVAACGDDPTTLGDGADFLRSPSRDAAPFQTDQLAYTLERDEWGYSARIDVVYTNTTATRTYFVNCNNATALVLEKRVDDGWDRVWSPVLPECLSAPIEVAPGGTWSTAVHVYGGITGSDNYPQFETDDLAGVYRLRYVQLLSTYDPNRYPFGEPLAEAGTISNRFVLKID